MEQVAGKKVANSSGEQGQQVDLQVSIGKQLWIFQLAGLQINSGMFSPVYTIVVQEDREGQKHARMWERQDRATDGRSQVSVWLGKKREHLGTCAAAGEDNEVRG